MNVTAWPEELNADSFFLRNRLEEGRGDDIAVCFDDGTVSYSEIDSLASGYGRLLLGAAVSRGDRVLIVLPDGPDFVAALFGILRIGAVVVMLNPGLTTEAMTAIVDSSRAAAVFVHSDHREHYEGPDQRLDEQWLDTAETGPDDAAIWLFSGGTTGTPKACGADTQEPGQHDPSLWAACTWTHRA